MKLTRRLLAIFLCIAIILSLAGCGVENTPTTPSSAPTAAQDPYAGLKDMYLQARKPIDDASALTLWIDATMTTVVGGERFKETSDQSVTLTGIGTEELNVFSKEDITFDNVFAVGYEEYFSGGTMYINGREGKQFPETISQEDYCSRIAPSVLLDAELYGFVTAKDAFNTTVLTFQEPTAPESWVYCRTSHL